DVAAEFASESGEDHHRARRPIVAVRPREPLAASGERSQDAGASAEPPFARQPLSQPPSMPPAQTAEGMPPAVASQPPVAPPLAHTPVAQPPVAPPPVMAPMVGASSLTPPPLVLVTEQMIDRIPPVAIQPGIGAPVPAPQGVDGSQSAALQRQRPMAPQIEIDGLTPGTVRTGRLSGVIGAGAAASFRDGMKSLPDQRLATAGADLDDADDQDDDLSAADEAGLISFVHRVGVKTMADMLEAAAAYAVCIEGRSQFTRSQLMRRLAACAEGRVIDREESLRSFGSLLRTGRVEKLNRGNYTLSPTSPYMAEARRFA
ncbi:MAG: hypothetical protein B7Y02_07955, partial [Rhodobacterales bacterium 17-64-5]